MPRAGENTQTNQTQTRASRSSGSQRVVGRRQERIRHVHSPEHPPRCSDGESNNEEDYAEYSVGKILYIVWEASQY